MKPSFQNNRLGRGRKRRKAETEWHCEKHNITFSRHADYCRHINTTTDHINERIPCLDPECPKTFNRSDNLRQHVARQHAGIQLPPVKRNGRPPKAIEVQKEADTNTASSVCTLSNTSLLAIENDTRAPPLERTSTIDPDSNTCWDRVSVQIDNMAAIDHHIPCIPAYSALYTSPHQQDHASFNQPYMPRDLVTPKAAPLDSEHLSLDDIVSKQYPMGCIGVPSQQTMIPNWRQRPIPSPPKTNHHLPRPHRTALYGQETYVNAEGALVKPARSEPPPLNESTNSLCEESRVGFGATVSEYDFRETIEAIDATARYFSNLGPEEPSTQDISRSIPSSNQHTGLTRMIETAPPHRKRICIWQELDTGLWNAIERVIRRSSKDLSTPVMRQQVRERLRFLRALEDELSQVSASSEAVPLIPMPHYRNDIRNTTPHRSFAAMNTQDELGVVAKRPDIRLQPPNANQPQEDALKSMGSWSEIDMSDDPQLSNMHEADWEGLMYFQEGHYGRFANNVPPPMSDSAYDTAYSYSNSGTNQQMRG